MIELLIESSWQTALMVVISTTVGTIIGLPLAVLLFITRRKGLMQNVTLNTLLGFKVNVIRSIPYIILMVALMPITRFLAGTTIGTLAASVSLSIASIMLIARVGEESLSTVDHGLIEAAQSMGATRLQIIYKVLIPEALPSLISGLTLVIISLIGFSAMAGAVGGGGLGDLAIRYGYQRYNMTVIIQVVVILVAFVQGVQIIGDIFAKKLRK